MATVAITPTELSANSGSAVTQGAGTAIVAADTNKIPYKEDKKLMLVVDSDNAATALTIAAGSGVSAGQGALTWAVGNATAEVLVLGESARFKDDDGNISITYAGSSAGFIRAFYLP